VIRYKGGKEMIEKKGEKRGGEQGEVILTKEERKACT
jgi:hypothetical protein